MIRALLFGLAIAFVVFALTGGHVLFLPLLFLPLLFMGGGRRRRRRSGFGVWPGGAVWTSRRRW